MPPKTMVGAVRPDFCSMVSTCCAFLSCAFQAERVRSVMLPPAMVAIISVEHSSSRGWDDSGFGSFRSRRNPFLRKRSIYPLSASSWRAFFSSLHSVVVWPLCSWNSQYFRAFCGQGAMVIGGGRRSIGCPRTSIRIFLASVVNRASRVSTGCLLSRGAGFLSPRVKPLSPGAFPFLGASGPSAQISVARMKSAAFLNASAKVISFCSAKENLKRSLLRLFRKEV